MNRSADINNQEALYTQATMPSDILPLTEEQLQNLTSNVPEVFTGRQVTDNYNIVTLNRVRAPCHPHVPRPKVTKAVDACPCSLGRCGAGIERTVDHHAGRPRRPQRVAAQPRSHECAQHEHHH